MSRLRKAWEVRVKGYDEPGIYYAATAGKARMQAWYSIDTIGRVVDITVRRARWRDVELPDRDPTADQLSDKAMHCLLHAFGADQGDPTKAGYRDYFYTVADDPPLVELSQLGLMSPNYRHSSSEGEIYFHMTAAGKRVALSLVPEYRP